jgi:hypothetical protein
MTADAKPLEPPPLEAFFLLDVFFLLFMYKADDEEDEDTNGPAALDVGTPYISDILEEDDPDKDGVKAHTG